MKYVYCFLTLFLFFSCNDRNIKADNSRNQKANLSNPKFHLTSSEGWIESIAGFTNDFMDYKVYYQHGVNRQAKRFSQLKYAAHETSDESWKELGTVTLGDTISDKVGGCIIQALGNKREDISMAYFSYPDSGIAFSISKDNEKSWSKPELIISDSLNMHYKHPRVRRKPTYSDQPNLWYMVVSGNDHFAFFTSGDLESWKKTSELRIPDWKDGDIYEHPDLIQLRTSHAANLHYVLLYSFKNEKTREVGVKYIVGDFDGKTYHKYDQQPKYLVEGPDHYAGYVYKDFQRVDTYYRGLIMNPFTSDKFSKIVSRNAISGQRYLDLSKEGGEYILRGKNFFTFHSVGKKFKFKDTFSLKSQSFQMEIKEHIKNLRIVLSNTIGETLSISIKDKILMLDGSGLKNENLDKTLLPKYETDSITDKRIRLLDVFFDVNVLEIVVNDGTKSITSLIAPEKPFTKIKIEGNKNDILFRDLDFYNSPDYW